MKEQKTEDVRMQEMPYEKFLRFGPEALTESELIAIILRTGTRDRPALEVARSVMELGKPPRDGLLGLYDAQLTDLTALSGIGTVKAVKLKAIAELSMRMSTRKAREGLCMTDPESIAMYYMERLRHLPNECVHLACFDAKGQLLGDTRLSEGSVNLSLISPRTVFLEALRCRAVNIILIHNHPSGDPRPSETDIRLTRTLYDVSRMMDIPLLDHIIIGDRVYYSFAREKELYEQ